MTAQSCDFLALGNGKVQRYTTFTAVAKDRTQASLLHPPSERATPRWNSVDRTQPNKAVRRPSSHRKATRTG